MVDLSQAALLIIDLQEDFLPPEGALAVKDGRHLIPSIIGLLDKQYNWGAIIATKDWHPPSHISFASNHKYKAPYDTKVLNSPDFEKGDTRQKEHVLWPDHCLQDSFGSKFPAEFEHAFSEIEKLGNVPCTIIKKGYLEDREYYSCFKDIWGLHQTECSNFLKENNIKTVYVVGIAFDYCVLNSAIDSAKEGFHTVVLSDLTKAVFPENYDMTTIKYEEAGVKVRDSSVLAES